MYHANEIRTFDEIGKAETAKLSDAENQLALGLIETRRVKARS
jgi:hypothetical protein